MLVFEVAITLQDSSSSSFDYYYFFADKEFKESSGNLNLMVIETVQE